jgi:cytochrome P450
VEGHQAIVTFDPFAPDVIADPYPHYRRLHDEAPVSFIEERQVWTLVRYDDVRAALRDHARMSSSQGVMYIRAPLPMMLTMDPPDHERLRRIVGREFAPKDIHRFRPMVEKFVAEGLDELAKTADVVASLAIPVPVRVMASIMGVPFADLPELRRISANLVDAFKITPVGMNPLESLAHVPQAVMELETYFTALIKERREHPADDLITKLLTPAEEGTLSEYELFWFCLLLLVAGIETTTNLIGNMVIALHGHPDQWDKLRRDPTLVPAAVHECLRYDAPIQGFFRQTSQDYPVGDTVIPGGSRVLLSFGAANRDPAQYDRPDVLDIERNPTDHLAFGAGIHRCLGAGLAELEGRVVLERLLSRVDSLDIDGEVVRTTNPTLRGATQLRLRIPERTKL